MQGLIDWRIFQFADGARRWIALTFLAGFIGSLANLLLLLLAGRVIVGIYEGHPLLSMADLFLGMLLAMAFRALTEGSREISAQRSAAIIKKRVRRRLYDHLQRLGPSFLERRNSGSLSATVVDGVGGPGSL